MSNLTVCMDQKNAKALGTYLRHTLDWMSEAWVRCGPGEE